MAMKAKHAHGSRKNLESAIANKIVDSFDVLFLSGEGENPAMGWLDKNGNPIILSPVDEVAKLEAQIETELSTKANIEEVEAAIATKANSSDVTELSEELATKVDAATVQTMIDNATASAIEVVEF